MTRCCTTIIAPVSRNRPRKAWLVRLMEEALSTRKLWSERATQRRQLRQLAANSSFLKDIGISQADALMEANKPFWIE